MQPPVLPASAAFIAPSINAGGSLETGLVPLENAPPPAGTSLIGQDGFMLTSSQQPWQPETAKLGGAFEMPDVFNPRWRQNAMIPESTPPTTVVIPQRPSSIPPPGAGREKSVRIIGKSLFRELKEQGYTDQQVLQAATETLSLVTEMLEAVRGRDRKVRRAEAQAEETSEARPSEAIQRRLRNVFFELHLAGYTPTDLVAIPTEMIGLVTQSIRNSVQ